MTKSLKEQVNDLCRKKGIPFTYPELEPEAKPEVEPELEPEAKPRKGRRVRVEE